MYVNGQLHTRPALLNKVKATDTYLTSGRSIWERKIIYATAENRNYIFPIFQSIAYSL